MARQCKNKANDLQSTARSEAFVAEEGPKWHLFLKERTLSRLEAILKEAGSNLTSSAYTEDGRIPTGLQSKALVASGAQRPWRTNPYGL